MIQMTVHYKFLRNLAYLMFCMLWKILVDISCRHMQICNGKERDVTYKISAVPSRYSIPVRVF